VKQAIEWRIFCGFELPADLRARLDDHIRRLREAVTAARASWSRPDNSHLTVKFFGNVAVDRLRQISEAAELSVKQLPPFSLEIARTGVFPGVNRARVLWIGVNDLSGQLTTLHRTLEEQCELLGFPREDRAYRPHLTIARIRTPEGARKLAELHVQTAFNPCHITLDELVVFRSEPGTHGSKYTAISRHRLRQSS
jgi:RNA 2',3'-cyclic 3'-phosphodiesterase